MSLQIRPMRVFDLPAVMSLVKRTEGLGFKKWEVFMVLTRALLRNWKLPQVAVLDGEIVGSVFVAEGLMAAVHHLTVAPHARGQNLGTRLVQAGLRKLYHKKYAARRVYITVLPDNTGARTFWTKFGCKLESTGDLVLFTLDLKEQTWLAQESATGEKKHPT